MNKRSGSNASAIELLKTDHRKVESLLDAFKKAEDDDERGELAEQICHELTVHAEIEENIFYATAREQFPERDIEILDEALIEHAVVKGLISEIRNSTPGEPLFDAKVKVLGELVRHHIKEEEGEMMPKVQRCDIDLVTLGTQLMNAKAELTAEEV